LLELLTMPGAVTAERIAIRAPAINGLVFYAGRSPRMADSLFLVIDDVHLRVIPASEMSLPYDVSVLQGSLLFSFR
jgi:hypothetical protein